MIEIDRNWSKLIEIDQNWPIWIENWLEIDKGWSKLIWFNLFYRVDVVWRPITSHLLVVCQHPHLRMRQWGCEAITFLTRHALQFNHEPPLKENNRLQTLLLSPLAELSAIPFPDVRQKQLDTVLHILHSSGEFIFILFFSNRLHQSCPLNCLWNFGWIERNSVSI